MLVSYDGTDYHGSQLQPNGSSIEEKLNEALSMLTGESARVLFASRTDAGVHALGNVAVFDTAMRMAADKFAFAINQRLPEDIRVLASDEVSAHWHPRKQHCRKSYTYRIFNSKIPNPLVRRYAHFCYYPLQLEPMRQAAACLIGEHDFASFCAAGSQAENTVRTIDSIRVEENEVSAWNGALLPGRMVTIRVTGSGFLYNMVRIIAGTLMEIGTGRRMPEEMKQILARRDRRFAGAAAPARGLTLCRIRFLSELPARQEVESEDWSYLVERRQPEGEPEQAERRRPEGEPEQSEWRRLEQAEWRQPEGEPEQAKRRQLEGEPEQAKRRRPEGEPEQSEWRRLEPGITERGKAGFLTIRHCADPDYESLLTRLIHELYRDGIWEIYLKDLEAPERLGVGKIYGYYRLEASIGAFPYRAVDRSEKRAETNRESGQKSIE